MDTKALQDLVQRVEATPETALLPAFAEAGADWEGAAPEELSAALVAAARCIELRSRALLPDPEPEPEDELPFDVEADDPPPEELAARLAAYEAYRSAAEVLRRYEARWSRRFPRPATPPRGAPQVDVSLEALLSVFQEVWERARPETRSIAREVVTVEARMDQLRAILSERAQAGGAIEFSELFTGQATRLDVVVTFLALLELVRLGEVQARQEGPAAPLLLGWTGRAKARRGR